VLPDGLEVVLQRRSWARDPVFDWLAAAGKVAPAEMYRTFNCGIGMVVVVKPADADAALAQLKAAGETASIIGRVASGTRGVVIEE
jgi:phosphoribosylformylglycinamidine cyclo-ligase